MFEEASGVSHLMVDANDPNFDMTTREHHRVMCNSDRTLTIEDRNGITYVFGKQQYLVQGSDLSAPYRFSDEELNSEHPVIFRDYQHVTEIRDKNGNAFTIEYELRHNRGEREGEEFQNSVFTVDEIKQNNSVVAKFRYDDPEQSNLAIQSPFAHLSRLTLTRSNPATPSLTVEYTVESVVSNSSVPEFNLTVARTNLPNGTPGVGVNNNMRWAYDYYPENSTAESSNLKSVTNPYGGVVDYTYEEIGNPADIDGLEIAAILSLIHI